MISNVDSRVSQLAPGMGSEDSAGGAAMIHLAWLRNGDNRQLVFGWAEFLPACFPPLAAHSFRSLRLKKDAPTLHVARYSVPSAAARDWFEAAEGGDLRVPLQPGAPTAGDGRRISAAFTTREPVDGDLSSSLTLPFLPAVHGAVRSKGMFGPAMPEVEAALANQPAASWLRENLLFDLVEHPEYVGSLLSVSHNPVIRDVSSRLHVEGDREVELVRVRWWPGTELKEFRLLAVERRMLGLGMPKERVLDGALVELDWQGKSDRTALALLHPEYGVCWTREPLSFLRSIRTTVDVVGATRHVVQRSDGKDGAETHFDVPWRDTSIVSVVGEDTDDGSPGNRQRRAEARRRQIALAASSGLKWFDNPATAQDAVRSIIGGARETLIVVDSYFGPIELRDFILAVTSPDVSVTVVTSAEYLSGAMPAPDGRPVVAATEAALAELRRERWADPKVLVMLGQRAPLHDRFIVADGRVWLSGNSLNAIGRRASVLIELPNPQEVLGHLLPYVNAARPFAEWLADRRAARAAPAGQGEG